VSHIFGFFHITNISNLYETQPVDFTYQGWFYNIAIRGDFQGDPFQLLELLKGMEREFSNEKRFQYAPRILDADILTFGNIHIETEELTIPHPKLESRRFVLVPLAEIFPEFIHPVSGLNIQEMLSQCKDDSIVTIFANHDDLNWQLEVSN
jgi:2-amino-4-hydroxy-6-hydroxymethyldihydropteridine diphosphokinase